MPMRASAAEGYTAAVRRLVTLTSLMLVLVAGAIVLAGVGAWLVVADPLKPAAAIVVLSGHMPFRALEAAAIYRDGWAPEIWLTRGVSLDAEAVLARLGVEWTPEDTYSHRVLERLGVPVHAIRTLPERNRNTADEVRSVHASLRRSGGQRVIIVTSKAHTRRVRAIWAAAVGESPGVIVRYARDDPYDARRWWQHTGDALDVTREVLGLLNAWAGFPVQPDRP